MYDKYFSTEIHIFRYRKTQQNMKKIQNINIFIAFDTQHLKKTLCTIYVYIEAREHYNIIFWYIKFVCLLYSAFICTLQSVCVWFCDDDKEVFSNLKEKTK